MKRVAVVSIMLWIAVVTIGLIGCNARNSPPGRSIAGGGTVGAGSSKARMNPSGDIPDSQVFVTYVSTAGGYKVDTPEGWARQVEGPNVRYTFDYDGLSIQVVPAQSLSNASGLPVKRLRALVADGKAVGGVQVTNVTIGGRGVVLLRYETNSAPNPVTNRRVRLDNNVYVYSHNGRLAKLRLWAPVGADNVDQWKRISRSFAWR